MPLNIHAEPWNVQRRLAELGLTEQNLRDAVMRGQLAWAACNPFHPRIYPPLVGWAETVAALREDLAAAGWEPSDEHNYSVAIDPAGQLAIAVATGNEYTGLVHSSPSTKASKGKHTVSAILVNQAQLTLFETEQARPSAEEAPERTTWLLLMYRDDQEIRCELSLPVSIGTDMRVDAWRERIILGSIPRDPQLLEVRPPQQPDLDIPVKRRA